MVLRLGPLRVPPMSILCESFWLILLLDPCFTGFFLAVKRNLISWWWFDEIDVREQRQLKIKSVTPPWWLEFHLIPLPCSLEFILTISVSVGLLVETPNTCMHDRAPAILFIFQLRNDDYNIGIGIFLKSWKIFEVVK